MTDRLPDELPVVVLSTKDEQSAVFHVIYNHLLKNTHFEEKGWLSENLIAENVKLRNVLLRLVDSLGLQDEFDDDERKITGIKGEAD